MEIRTEIKLTQNNKRMKAILKIALSMLLFSNTFLAQAQKKPFYNEEEQVIEAAYNTLEQEMKNGELLEWAKEQGIKGAYTFNITIRGKGEVATVSVVKREGEINDQNILKDYIKTMRFPFKMPKDKSYKFQYEFKF